MLCPYLRSSSVNTWDFCQMQYVLQYMFGMKNNAGKSAGKGSMCHKIFELRGQAKMAEDDGKSSFVDDNFGEVTVEWAKDIKQTYGPVFDYYQKKETWNKFLPADKNDVLNWSIRMITDYPQYDPYNINKIVCLEKFFDISIDEEWAKYETVIGETKYSGNLSIKGTIDSILDHGNGVYEVFDLKSGAHRKDFKTGEPKTLEYLAQKDKQLLFYLYAIKKYLFPDKEIMLSLYFINAGGIFTVHGDDEMFKRAEKIVQKTFKDICHTFRPSVFDKSQNSFQCKYCCAFSKPYLDTGKSICTVFQEKITELGLKKCIEEYGDKKSIGKYDSGGGRDETTRKTTSDS